MSSMPCSLPHRRCRSCRHSLPLLRRRLPHSPSRSHVRRARLHPTTHPPRANDLALRAPARPPPRPLAWQRCWETARPKRRRRRHGRGADFWRSAAHGRSDAEESELGEGGIGPAAANAANATNAANAANAALLRAPHHHAWSGHGLVSLGQRRVGKGHGLQSVQGQSVQGQSVQRCDAGERRRRGAEARGERIVAARRVLARIERRQRVGRRRGGREGTKGARGSSAPKRRARRRPRRRRRQRATTLRTAPADEARVEGSRRPPCRARDRATT